jgi:hypothetical protein
MRHGRTFDAGFCDAPKRTPIQLARNVRFRPVTDLPRPAPAPPGATCGVACSRVLFSRRAR